jgi:hypothetical protein
MERSSIYSLMIALALLAGWESACRGFDIADFILPAPSRILVVAISGAAVLLPHAVVTAMEVLAGIIISLLVAVPLSILMFARPWALPHFFCRSEGRRLRGDHRRGDRRMGRSPAGPRLFDDPGQCATKG